MKAAKDFKSGKEFMEYFRSLSFDDKEKFVELNQNNRVKGNSSKRNEPVEYLDLTYEEIVKKIMV